MTDSVAGYYSGNRLGSVHDEDGDGSAQPTTTSLFAGGFSLAASDFGFFGADQWNMVAAPVNATSGGYTSGYALGYDRVENGLEDGSARTDKLWSRVDLSTYVDILNTLQPGDMYVDVDGRQWMDVQIDGFRLGGEVFTLATPLPTRTLTKSMRTFEFEENVELANFYSTLLRARASNGGELNSVFVNGVELQERVSTFEVPADFDQILRRKIFSILRASDGEVHSTRVR